jgi:hypothetical protein
MQIRFPITDIPNWAARYPAEEDHHIETFITPQVRQRGYFTQPEFVDICRWKTPRSQKRVNLNPESYIQAVTQTALSTTDERLRIEVLTLLDGVSWPTASVILHFCHAEPYPILDFRALWSLGIETPPVYQFDFWWEYTCCCRDLAAKAGVSMRILDRALWQYSYEKQRTEGIQ